MVGTSKFEKSKISVFGYSQTGGRHLRDTESGNKRVGGTEKNCYTSACRQFSTVHGVVRSMRPAACDMSSGMAKE